jgi:photosystem II stability/assembly factor-like uncharacterized protein
MHHRFLITSLLTAALAATVLMAQQVDPAFYAGLRWRLIGPYRSGQIAWVTGVAGDPTVYYAATPGGGIWKTTDGGTVWAPIFDATGEPSVGTVEVAPSDPDVVYAGTGNTMLGHGVYKSTDAGSTWAHVGLDDTRFITAMLIDPHDSDLVLVGVGSGGNFGSMVYYNNNPSPARGVYRTTDGGRTWSHVLFVDPQSGVIDLGFDPASPRTVYASLTSGPRAGRGGPPESPGNASGPVLYRSTDEGATWQRLDARGLPPGAANAHIAVAAGTQGRRLYALVGGRGGGGVFRSDDGGGHWTLTTSRTASASGHIYVDPRNPDVVYAMGTSMYRSTDAGATFQSYKGAPGGDDERVMWINPRNPSRMIVGADQGPTITVDDGQTWTPWYNLPNGELYYVSTDNQFPYWVYAAQQDSGTVAIRSRSDYGAIRPSDWYPVSGYEEGHIYVDPFDPRYVITHGGGHTVLRFDRDTGQVGPIYTPRGQDRFGPRPAMAYSSRDPHRLFLGAQCVLETDDGGANWRQISPDLTVTPGGAPPGPPAAGRGGRGGGGGGATLVALAPSPIDANLLWAGSSNGLIHLTRDDGREWQDVSPPALASTPTLTLWSIEASPHDAGTAYATAIDLSDAHGPAVLRTHDFGRSWTPIVNGLPADVPTRVVREDPEQANLLYAGTQAGMWVSFDRGDHWQSLQLNLPPSPVNDITVHGDDLVISTYGRALWILDDVTPLRQIDAVRAGADPAFLFQPETAWRVRWDNNQDTPLPPEVPTGQNPPDGAILDYYLRSPASAPVTLSILDASGGLVREYTSTPAPPDETMPNVPMYWFEPPRVLPTAAGMHRVVWDLRYPTPPSLNYGPDGNPSSSTSYGIIATAIVGESPREQPVGPLALPGTYRVRLVVAGQTYERSLTVKNDPRVAVSQADLEAHLSWERALTAGITVSHQAIEELRRLRAALAARDASASAGTAAGDAIRELDRSALEVITALASNRALGQHLATLEYADMKPTASTVAALQEACGRTGDAVGRYRQVAEHDVPALNRTLAAAGMPLVTVPAALSGSGCGR